MYGVKQVRTWRDAAMRFLLEIRDQPSIKLSAHHLSQLDPYIGGMPLINFGGRCDERPVVLNTVAKSIIEKQRGISKEWVFPYNGTAMHRMNDSAWKKARVRAAKLWQEKNLRPAHPGYLSIRIHDLKHTFGRRLRAAGVTEEDRKALLGHKNGSTSHYSGAELGHLLSS